MAINIEDLPCAGKRLKFSRPIHIELDRVSEEDFYILEDIGKDCSNIKNYKYEYSVDTKFKNGMFLRVGLMVLSIIVKKEICEVVEIVHLVELKES